MRCRSGHPIVKLKGWTAASVMMGVVGLVSPVAILAGADVPDARDAERNNTDEPPDACPQPYVDGIGPRPYLNGLPVVGRAVEIVGDRVKVFVVTTPRCEVVTPASLPYEWQVTGPDGTVTLPGGTLSPHFTPATAGAYEARLIYCRQGCENEAVGNDTVDIPELTSSLHFDVVDEIILPPTTEPVLTPTALKRAPTTLVDKEERERQCGAPGVFYSQLVPVSHWSDASDYELLEGRVETSGIAGEDYYANHDSHDVAIHVQPDPQYERLTVQGAGEMEVEWESNTYPAAMRPIAKDRISAFGFHTYDCHHSGDVGILTEIHPAVLTAVHRVRPIEIPDGWGGLGSDIFVPGIITDIWANARAGEMTSHCSSSGLHQANEPPLYQRGACIQSPHPLRRVYTFNIYLPENPQKRMAAAGITAPPVPLHWRVEPPDPNLVVTPDFDDGSFPHTPQTDDDVWYLKVTLDLPGYVDAYGSYARRIVAGWALPSQDNWGLERWMVGIDSLEVLNDHEPDSSYPPPPRANPGAWTLWMCLNNRDREWIQLLDDVSIFDGNYHFGTPWQTESGDGHGPRSLGTHLLLFSPGPGRQFPGLPEQDLTQTASLFASGYEEDGIWSDDALGGIPQLVRPAGLGLSVGQRQPLTANSSTGDYRLHYFIERLGPVAPANLWPAGRDLVAAYTIKAPRPACRQTRNGTCVVFPDAEELATAWHPLLAPVQAGTRSALAWHDHPIYKTQEAEERSPANVPLDVLGRSLVATRAHDPQRVERFFVELREELQALRGTRRESEIAQDLPLFEANLPADLWQLHLGGIDPTPVDLALEWVRMAPPNPVAGQKVAFSAEIVNKGSGAAASFSLQSQVDGRMAGTIIVPSLAPGAATTVTFPVWEATVGSHRLRVMADARARITEPAEDNNALDMTFVVNGARR
jgi:hypothetical protein